MFDLKELGQRIKSRRLELEITQDELAKKVGYTSRSSINKIELGCVDLSQSKITAIAAALFISPIELMGYPSQSEKIKPISKSPQSSFISEREMLVLKAYRENPSFQSEVDRLLGFSGDYEELYEAASSVDNRPPKMVQKAKAEWAIISNAPETDQDLK